MFEVFMYLFTIVFVLWFMAEPKPRKNETYDELLMFPSKGIATDWNLTSTQLRSLCALYDIPCSKRGRIGQAALVQLMEVA